MGLLGNYSIQLKNPNQYVAGPTISTFRSNWNNAGLNRHIFFGAFGTLTSLPGGYRQPNCMIMAAQNGGLSFYGADKGIGMELEADAAAGLGASANIDITLDVFGIGGLIVNAIASLLIEVTTNASVVGKLEAVCALSMNADLTAAITGLGHAVADLTANMDVAAQPFGIAHASIDITSLTELSPDSLAAAVWNALAASLNSPGTMGEKLNSAGGGSSPTDIAEAVWDELLESHGITGSAADKLKKLKSGNFLNKG